MIRLCVLFLAAPLVAQAAPAFNAQVDAYYHEWAGDHPVEATALGWHEHDGELGDWSAAAVQKRITWLHGWAKRWADLDGKSLTPAQQLDLTALRLSVESQLVSLETIQSWRRRPDLYSQLASEGVYVIMKRSFAPEADRLRLVVARERQVPAMLTEARKNLTLAPRISVEIALSEIPDIIEFFKKDVPSAFPSVKDHHELDLAGAAAQKALAEYAAWLKQDLLPRGGSDFAIGEAAFRKKLHAEEMIDTPLDSLLERGQHELGRLQEAFKSTARTIDGKKSFTEVQLAMQKDHPAPERLIPDTQARLDGLRQFLVDHQIVSLPSPVMPRVQETPPFMRATTFASMDTPGPFETRATEAYYNVTLPDKAWTPAQVEDYMSGAFNRGTIETTSIHEAFPGHYVQFLWMPHLVSKVRRVESANTNVEGWAHYTEQMIVDEGYGGGDPKLRLAQLQDALLRAARYVVGIRMHTRRMSYAEAVDFFQKQGYQSRKVAEMETKRGTEDPTYLYYTLGKLEILRLRDDYRKKLGAGYTLQKFHDAFLAEGALPLPLVRKALLGE